VVSFFLSPFLFSLLGTRDSDFLNWELERLFQTTIPSPIELFFFFPSSLGGSAIFGFKVAFPSLIQPALSAPPIEGKVTPFFFFHPKFFGFPLLPVSVPEALLLSTDGGGVRAWRPPPNPPRVGAVLWHMMARTALFLVFFGSGLCVDHPLSSPTLPGRHPGPSADLSFSPPPPPLAQCLRHTKGPSHPLLPFSMVRVFGSG